MNHKTDIEYEGGYKKVAIDLADLTYDSLSDFLRCLADKIYMDATKDDTRGRRKLAIELYHASQHISEAWNISKPYMP